MTEKPRDLKFAEQKAPKDELSGRAARLKESGRFGRQVPQEEPKEESRSGRGAITAIGVSGALLFAGACTNEVLDITDAGTSACEIIEVSTRCTVDTPNHKVCMVYEGNAVEIDGIRFTAKDIAPEGRATDFDYEVRDELLECEPTGAEGTIPFGEEVSLSIGGQPFKMRVPTVTPPGEDSAGWAELDVEKVVDEPPQPAACPAEATRCTDDEFGRTCEVREGKAISYDGYLWEVSDVSLDYGTGKFKLTIIDPEADCGIVGVIADMHEGDTEVRILVGGFNYAFEAPTVQAVYDPHWVLGRVSKEVSYCEAVDIPIECDVGTESGLDTVRCPLYTNMGAIKFGNIMFAIDRMYRDTDGNDRLDLRIYDAAMGCSPQGGFTLGEYSVSPTMDIGLYRYQATVGAIDRATGVADVRITREKIMCGAETHFDPIYLGEWAEAPNGYKVRLDDLTRDLKGGIFTVLDASDREVFVFVLNKGDTLLLPEFGFEARVDEVAPGLLFLGKWAKLTLADCASG